VGCFVFFFFFSSRRRHTRFDCDWSSDVCSSDLRSWRHQWRRLGTRGESHRRGSRRGEAGVGPKGGRRRHDQLRLRATSRRGPGKIGRASCREKSVDRGGRRIIKKKKKKTE